MSYWRAQRSSGKYETLTLCMSGKLPSLSPAMPHVDKGSQRIAKKLYLGAMTMLWVTRFCFLQCTWLCASTLARTLCVVCTVTMSGNGSNSVLRILCLSKSFLSWTTLKVDFFSLSTSTLSYIWNPVRWVKFDLYLSNLDCMWVKLNLFKPSDKKSPADGPGCWPAVVSIIVWST